MTGEVGTLTSWIEMLMTVLELMTRNERLCSHIY